MVSTLSLFSNKNVGGTNSREKSRHATILFKTTTYYFLRFFSLSAFAKIDSYICPMLLSSKVIKVPQSLNRTAKFATLCDICLLLSWMGLRKMMITLLNNADDPKLLAPSES